MKRIVTGMAAVFSLATMFVSCGFGQTSATSSLSGTVADPSGAVIPGAEATARNDATGAEFKAITTENGTFAMPVLATGVYTVTVSLPGFKQAVLKDVKLDVGVPATIRITLE